MILFLQFELSHFSGILIMKVNRQRVPCVRNSSYSFIPIILKLYRCLHHTLKMCMWFGYNPQVNFWHFFCKLNLVVFRYFDNESEWTVGALCAQLLLQFLIQIFWNFTDVLMMLWRYACALDIILRLIFDTFSQFELSRFSGIYTMKVNGHCVPCVQTPPSVLLSPAFSKKSGGT